MADVATVSFRKFCGNYREGKGFLEVYKPSSGTEVYISRQWNKPPSKNSTSSWRRKEKEVISQRQPKEHVFNILESSEEDEEAFEAMAEIDKFGESLKQKEIIKPE